jgi:ABC-type transport system involved in cytochrome bd biosynthesis fused ATPase/permease subunit
LSGWGVIFFSISFIILADAHFSPLRDFSLAHEHAAAQLHAGEKKFAFFTPEEARQMEAVWVRAIGAGNPAPMRAPSLFAPV